jgi:hypothetical protein
MAKPGCTIGVPAARRGSESCRRPSSRIMTCMCANTSSINLFPQVQGGEYQRSGGGRRLSSGLPVQSGHRENRVGTTSRISLAFPTQSPPHTGHLIHLSPRLALPIFPNEQAPRKSIPCPMKNEPEYGKYVYPPENRVFSDKDPFPGKKTWCEWARCDSNA